MEQNIRIILNILNGSDHMDELVSFIKDHGYALGDFCQKYGISQNTLYKLLSKNRRDFRISTLRKIHFALTDISQPKIDFIAIIAPRTTIDSLATYDFDVEGKSYKIKGYYVENIIDLITQSVKAEKDGAKGIICGPLAASAIKETVDIPISSLTDSAVDVALVNMKAKLSSGRENENHET